MEINFDLATFTHLAACVLGVVSGIVLLYQGIKSNPVNLPLAFGQIILAVAIWVSFLVVSQLLVHWPFLFRTGSFFALVFVPLPFLYVRFYTEKRTWRWYDFLHFIPALVFLVDFWPIFTLSNQEKLALILKDIADENQFALLRESRFFPPGFHQSFRTILFSVYWLVEIRLVYRWIKAKPNLGFEERIWKNWMFVYLAFQMAIWLPFFLTFIWIDPGLTYHMVYTAGAAWLVVSSFLLLLYPSLVYGQANNRGHHKAPKQKPTELEQGNELLKLQEVKTVIEAAMERDALFLKPGYTINDFSRDIGIPVYQVSKCISHFEGISFIDFINRKRVEYCAQKLEAGEWRNLKIEALALECGFKNRNSFTNAFKKFKGIPPSEYISRQK
jgi:AraC-like DNA-binding protein